MDGIELCFVFSLYRGLSPYTRCLQQKIARMKSQFSNSMFVVVADEATASACAPFVDPCAVWRIYDMDKVTSQRGMASFARFHVVFDPTLSHKTMFVLDVHDDTEEQIKQMKSAFKNLLKNHRQVFFMYVKSDEDCCPYHASAHKTVHTHRDAGFSVWLQGSLRNEHAKTFATFWDDVQTHYNAYGYGADEVLIDHFLTNYISDIRKYQSLARNTFLSCKPNDPRLPDDIVSPHLALATALKRTCHDTIKFHGQYDMYICPRVEYFE